MSVLFLNVNFQGNDKLSSALEKMGSTAEKLQSKIDDTKSKLAELEKFQFKNDKFVKLKAEFDKNTQALENNRKLVKALQQQMAQGGGQQLSQQLKKAQNETQKLENAVNKGKAQLINYRKELNQAGHTGKSFADMQNKIRENIDKTNTSLQKQQVQLAKASKYQARYEKIQGFGNKSLEAAKTAFQILMTAGSTLSIPVKLAIDGEKSMADVAKVVDGLKIDGKVTAEYHKFEKEITELSNRLGMSFAEVSAIIAGGAQGGIAKNELLQYGEAAVKIGIAWDMAADKVGQSLAELRSTFQLSQSQVEHFADQINFLGNNSTNAAPYILDVVQYVGAIGKAAKMNEGSIAAMAASISGIDASTAGTGIKNVLKTMTAGTSATKSQKKAWLELGFTSEEVAKRMQIDAEGMYLDTLKALQKLPEEQRLAMAKSLFQDEALPVVSQHLTNFDKLQGYVKDVKDLQKIQGSVDGEYNSAKSTTAFKLQKARVQIANMAKDFGTHLLPIVGMIAEKVGNVAQKISDWARENPQAVKFFAMVAAAVTGLLFAVTAVAGAMALLVMPFAWLNLMLAKMSGGALTLGGVFKALLNPIGSLKTAFATIKTFALSGFTKLGAVVAKLGSLIGGLFGHLLRFGGLLLKMASWLNPFKLLPAVFGLVKTAIFGVGTALRFLTTSLLTNPIGLAIAGIAVAAVLIYKYWNPIKAFFAGVWDGIKAGLAPLMSAFSGLGSYISPVINWFKNLFNITQVGEGNARSLGQTVGGFLANSFMLATTPIRLLWNTLKWLWDSITGLFKGEISIGDIFAGLWAKFEGAIAKITEWKNKAVKLWDDFWSVFKSNKSQSPTAESGAGGSGGGFWSSIASGLESAKNTISQKAGGLWESAKAKFDEAKISLGQKAGEIWSSVTNALNGASGGVGISAMIAGTMSQIIAAIGTAASTIGSVLSSIIATVSAGITGILSVFRTVFSAVPTIVGVAMSALPAIFAAALSVLPAMVGRVFSGLATTVGSAMMSVINVIRAKMIQAVLAITQGFVRMRSVIGTMWRSMGSAMSGNPILAKVQSAMNATLGYLNGIKGRFVAIGADIAAGLARGIQANIGQVKAASAQLAAAVESAARIEADTHSPSRVMMLVGSDMVAGLDVGMQKRFAPTLNNFKGNIAHLTDTRPVVRATPAIGRSVGVSHYTGGAVNITINAPAGSNSQDIAQMVAKELQKHQKNQALRQRASFRDNQ